MVMVINFSGSVTRNFLTT